MGANARTCRILIASDRRQTSIEAEKALRSMVEWTVRVDTASTTNAAARALAGATYQLVVVDSALPGGGANRLVRAAGATTPPTACVLLSSAHVSHNALLDTVEMVSVLQPAALVAAVKRELNSNGVGIASVPRFDPEARARPRAAIERDIRAIEQKEGLLRVQYGLGSISPEGYAALAQDLRNQRAALETERLRARDRLSS